MTKPGTCLWCLCKLGETRPALVPSSRHELDDELAVELGRMMADEAQRAARLTINPPGDRVAFTVAWLSKSKDGTERPFLRRRCQRYCNAARLAGELGPLCPHCDHCERMLRVFSPASEQRFAWIEPITPQTVAELREHARRERV